MRGTKALLLVALGVGMIALQYVGAHPTGLSSLPARAAAAAAPAKLRASIPVGMPAVTTREQSPSEIALSSVRETLVAIRSARESVVVSAYTLSLSSPIVDALRAARARQVPAAVVIAGTGIASAVDANLMSAAALRAAGIGVALLVDVNDAAAAATVARAARLGIDVIRANASLHLKGAVIDHRTAFLSDRNWTRDERAMVVRIPIAMVATVEAAIAGEARAVGPLQTSKAAALAEEAAFLRAARGACYVESESFDAASPVYTALLERARAGEAVTVVVTDREYLASAQERDELAALRAAAPARVVIRVSTSAEKIAWCGAGAWVGSSNSTGANGAQIDWGATTTDPPLVNALARLVSAAAEGGHDM